jgi:hypothetical protein
MASVAVWAGSGDFEGDAGPSNPFLIELEDGSGVIELEDGSGGILLEQDVIATWTGSGAFVGNVSSPVGLTVGNLTGQGAAAWVGSAVTSVVASLTGQGVFAGVAVGAPSSVATLAGSGALAGVGALTAASVAVLTGSGMDIFFDKFANAPSNFTMTGRGALNAVGFFNVPNVHPFWSIPIDGNIISFVAYNWQTLQMFVGYENQTFIVLDNISLGTATQIRTAAPNAQAMVLALVKSYAG